MPDPVASAADTELRAHLERVLGAHYDLDCEIGRGGMGVVYRARDRRLKRSVAIKLLPPELSFRSEIRTRFLKEAEMAAQLSHPNIVPIYSVDEQDNLVFFVMACVEGENIAKRIHDKGSFGVDEARHVLKEVADALAYAHSRGVVHRDIKPDNIIIDSETGRPMVTDFGIARAITDTDSRLTATGIAIGTPAFMSPEQSVGDREIDGRSDLYSLGIVGYQMLCGDLPFKAGNTPAMLMKHISEAPVPIQELRPDVPPDLARAVMLLLEKDPEDRFPSASALAVALDGGDMPTPRPRTGTQPQRQGEDAGRRMPAVQQAEYDNEYVPAEEEVRRWHAPAVLRFRKKLAYYIPVNAVIVFFAILGSGGFMAITVFWSVYMAFKYAGLWSDGYDWRDIFRQPRHRELLDVASEAIDEASALFDKEKRRELRERARRRTPLPAPGRAQQSSRHLDSGTASPRPVPNVTAGSSAGVGAIVRQAAADRDEIVRVVQSMSRSEKSQIPDVVTSARALYDRVKLLAESAAQPANSGGAALPAIDREIEKLEAEANPLDRVGSESRVRRLAMLKRQRRATIDLENRHAQAVGKLEECALALQSIRLDVLRLRAGSQSYQHVTSLAEQALELARDVDNAMYVADEMSRLTSKRSGTAGADKL